MDGLITLWQETGIANFELEQIIMILVGCTLLFLAIRKGFEPLLLLPIGFGAVLANIPNAGFTEPVACCTTFTISVLSQAFSHC